MMILAAIMLSRFILGKLVRVRIFQFYPIGKISGNYRNRAYGKIKGCMPSVLNDTKYDPPRMIPSLVEGFNAVANNVYLIVFPIVLDLLFWMGPRLRVKKFFLPILLDAAELSSAAYGEQAVDFLEITREIWTSILEQFNLLFSLRTFPIGIPSLLVSYMADINPIGFPINFDINSGNMVLVWLTALLFAGLLLGSIYYALTAHAVVGKRSLNMPLILNQIAQAFILSIIFLVCVTILALPVSCLLSSMMLTMPSLGTFPIVILGMVLVWVFLPLVFSPHGIFASQLKATKSIVTSFRLVRSLMAATGMFFIILITINYGLDILWTTPEADSWLLLVGIFGHAFISSGLLAASFIYYDRGIKWLQSTVESRKEKKPTTVS